MDPELIAEEARNAQRRREWAEAAALWDSYSKLKPKDVRGWTALGQIAVAAGDLDRARELAGALLEKFPGSDAGPLLLARVAATSGDTEGTLAQYRAALVLKPKNRQTMRALGRALITSEQFDEAETWARKLTEQWPGEPDGIVQLAQIAERQSNAAAALRRYRRAHNAFPSNAPVTREFVKHLIRAGEIDEARGVVDVFADIDPAEAVRIRGDHLRQFSPGVDALAFWAEAFGLHGDDPAIARELADVALRRGDVLLAEKGLRGVIGLGASRLNDCRFVIGIANLHAQAGDSAAVRSLVRGYLKALKPSPDYRIAALKLSPLIFVHFLRAETGKRRRRRNSVRTGRMLERAPVPSTTKSFLARGIVLERQLRSRGPALLETGVSRGQAERFVAVVQDRLARGKPFSFVRLGDGESNCLRYEPELRHHFAHDAQEREVVWWGSSLSDEVRERFARRVATAVWQSDAIGIPTVSRFLRDLRLDTEDTLVGTRGGRGLRGVLFSLEHRLEAHAKDFAEKTMTSCHLHQDLERWNLYPAIFKEAPGVITVSRHADMPEALEKRFGVASQNLVIPPRHADIGKDSPLELRRVGWLPDVIDEIAPQLRAVAKGKLVLIAAGYLGKHLVQVARKAGAVALDVGSIADYWMGQRTRSYLDI